MRTTIRFFAWLDVISILLLAKQFSEIVTHLNDIPNEFFSKTKVILLVPLFCSLFVSAAGLFLVKKFGFITSYIQFPFRLVLWVFSIGFITYIPELLNLQGDWFNILFKICFVTEFFRLYFSIKIHRKMF